MATWIIGGLLVLTVAGIIWKMIRDHRNGKGSCGGDCAHCHAACGTQNR